MLDTWDKCKQVNNYKLKKLNKPKIDKLKKQRDKKDKFLTFNHFKICLLYYKIQKKNIKEKTSTHFERKIVVVSTHDFKCIDKKN
jgi:hypothetical protein